MASSRSDESDDDDSEDGGDEDVAAEPRPEDKENTSPIDASVKSSEQAKGRTGRKRKRQTAAKATRQAQDAEATRRQRIRQYYNGATHGSASAVQLFAMAMQVRKSQEAYVPQSADFVYNDGAPFFYAHPTGVRHMVCRVSAASLGKFTSTQRCV